MCVKHGGGRPRCQRDGCDKRARHDPVKNETKFCVEHGGGPRCQHPGCGNGAQHDPVKKETMFCIGHGGGPRCQHHGGCGNSAVRDPVKKETMFCVEHGGGPRCQHHGGCGNGALRDPVKKETKFCILHGGGPRCSMVDVHKFEDIPPFARYNFKNGDRGCLFCIMSKEPSHEKVRTFVNREVLVSTGVDARLPELAENAIKITCDETLGACSMKRPDMMWDFGWLVIWIEINERQHQTYDPTCEKDRRYQIWEDIACRPALLIEFNPDEYDDLAGKTHPGMFRDKRLSGGERRVVPNGAEFDRRMDALVQLVQKGLDDFKSGAVHDGIKQEFLFYTPSVESQYSMYSM